MATKYIKQATKQLAPVYDQQIQAVQSQLPSIQNLYQTLTQGLQNQYDTNLASGVQSINEDASARGVLRSTLPTDARTTLTSQLGQALQESLGQLGRQQAADVSDIQGQLGQLRIGRASSIADLARALESQDIERQRLALQKQEAERSYRLAKQQSAAGGGATGGGATGGGYYYTRNSSGGMDFYEPGGGRITAAQYVGAQGGTAADLVYLLENVIGTPSAKAAAKLYQKDRQAALKKYPYVFLGA